MKQCLLAVVCAAAFVFLPGCESAAFKSSGDPLADMLNKGLDSRVRARSVESARLAASGNTSLEKATDKAISRIAWDPLEDPTLRVAAIESLFRADGDIAAQARADAHLNLPSERARPVVVAVCRAAAENNWTDLVPPILRAYSRPAKGVEDHDRAERQALSRLVPGADIERAAFEVFAKSPSAPPGAPDDWQRFQRHDALNVLSQMDPTASRWRAWLDSLPEVSTDPQLAAILACRNDLRCVPMTGPQLEWLISLRNAQSRENSTWWSEASSAIQQVRPDEPLYLRHAEPIRWAAANKPEWLAASRSDLLNQVRTMLDRRTQYQRSAEQESLRVKDRLPQVQDKLSWADLLAILVIDEQLKSDAVREAFFRQSELDNRDTTTEYGGLIEIVGAAPRAALHLPRGSERQGDTKFVASIDMILASDRALAHYHLHVQSWRNQDYSGPSPADLEYATRYGRSCIVLTSINDKTLSVDYYQPFGVALDLGTISR